MSVLTGRALVAAMCAGQVGNLLPHVVVPAIMAEHLIPLWGLSAAQAGLMAGAYAFGYMLAVPVLATLTDRIDARLVLLCGLRAQRSGDRGVRTVRRRPVVGDRDLGARRHRVCRRLHAGPEGADRPAAAARSPRAASRSIRRASRSASACRFSSRSSSRRRFGWRAAFFVTALGPLVMIAACFAMAPFRPAPAQGICSISARCCATASRWATCSATARIASSFTACAPGSWRSGPTSRRATAMRLLLAPIAVSVLATRAVAARQHPRQRGRDPLRPPPRHHGGDVRLGRGRARDRVSRRRVAAHGCSRWC